jgi:hypothetical protein
MTTAKDRVSRHPVAREFLHRGEITEADISRLRRELFADGIVNRHEAELLLDLNVAVARQCREWTPYLTEALTDHLVEQAEPRGHISPAGGQWLIATLLRDSRAFRANEVEMIVRILNRAHSAPEALASFALTHVVGFAAAAEPGKPSAISEAEVELIRMVLYAFGGEQGISISRAEAEALFDLNDRTDPDANHPAWQELFVKAIGNYLMAAAAYQAPSRVVALAREEWLENRDTDLKSFVTGALSGFAQLFSGALLDEIEDAHTQIERAWAERNARHEAEAASSEVVTSEEAGWLIDRLTRDGKVHPAEKALLSFLQRESPDVDPSLKPWFDKIAAKA